ncbi:hypothetical protein TSAR_000042, partial [Trichomalopsis sarcophagae]
LYSSRPVCASIRNRRLVRDYNDIVNKSNVDVQRLKAKCVQFTKIVRIGGRRRDYNIMVNECNVDVQKVEAKWVQFNRNKNIKLCAMNKILLSNTLKESSI